MSLFSRVSLQEKILFAKHLSIMVRSGIPLVKSLGIIQHQIKSGTFRKIIDELTVGVNNGQFLSAGLERYVRTFGNAFVNIVKIGETSGNLSENLNHLSIELKKKYDLERKVRGALIYPVIILVAVFGLGAVLTLFIFPKIMPIFERSKIILPLPTRILIVVVNFLSEYGLWVVVGLVAAAVIMKILLKIPAVRFYYLRFFIAVPFIGKIIKSVNMANFTRTLATLIKSGVKIVEALGITADSMGNEVYRREVRAIAEGVRRGETIAEYLVARKRLFPLTAAQMVEVGEAAGNLEENLIYLSEFYEEEVDDVLKNLSNTVEPVLILVMGIIVGFIALAIITPIYAITRSF